MKIRMMLWIVGILMIMPIQNIYAERIGDGPHADNCVLYLKNVRNIHIQKSGLYTLEDKRAMINKNNPKKGRVAIIRTPGFNDERGREIGHVALVTKVDDEGKKKSITIEEANFPSSGYWKRKATGKKMKDVERELNIVGYYQP